MYKTLICVLILWCSFLCAETNLLVIDNFESKQNQNLLGGICGGWERMHGSKEYCNSGFADDNVFGKKSSVLKLEFKLTSIGFNGYFTKLNNLDLRPYEKLELSIRADEEISFIKLEVKNSINEVGYYYLVNITTGYQKVSIPLKSFRNITDFSKIKELTFVFEGRLLGDFAGSVFVDDLVVSSSEKEFEKRMAVILKEKEKRMAELRKIAELPDDEFLDLISRNCFNYFISNADGITCFVKDRTGLYVPSSIAATGFGLAAICIGDSRNWISHEDAVKRVNRILTSLRDKASNENGFFYHFIDLKTGERAWDSEVSSIDTALLLEGVILVREYFKENDIKKLCDDIYLEVNWKWMLDKNKKTLYMGWTPEDKFRKSILWDMFGEGMVMYILGLGSPRYPLPKKSWDAFNRPVKNYKGNAYIYCDSESLFTYQYSQGFIDFRNKHDGYADYWQNSLSAIKSSIEFCIEHSDKYRTYREGYWGISASDGPSGYKNYGATIFTNDGTVAPYAICASVAFVPEIVIPTLRKLILEYGNNVWDDNYGFVSAFNLDKNWFSTDHIGIDLGITLLMIENYRNGFVWKYFMKNKYINSGMKKARFKSGSKELDVAFLKQKFGGEKIATIVQKQCVAEKIGSSEEIKNIKKRFEKFDIPQDLEFGSIEGEKDLSSEFVFYWDDEYLYSVVKVVDDRIVANQPPAELYRDDCIELFLNPNSDILIWGDKKNYQIGFAPNSSENKPAVYTFFQKIIPDEKDIKIISLDTTVNGYEMTSAISWKFLNLIPEKGKSFGISVAVHDVDGSGGQDKKINWCFKNTAEGIKLGRVVLK